jgi:hypothetical protein
VQASVPGKSSRAPELLWIGAPDEQSLRCTTFDSATIVTLDDCSGGIAIVSPLHGEGWIEPIGRGLGGLKIVPKAPSGNLQRNPVHSGADGERRENSFLFVEAHVSWK